MAVSESEFLTWSFSVPDVEEKWRHFFIFSWLYQIFFLSIIDNCRDILYYTICFFRGVLTTMIFLSKKSWNHFSCTLCYDDILNWLLTRSFRTVILLFVLLTSSRTFCNESFSYKRVLLVLWHIAQKVFSAALARHIYPH